MAEYRNFKNLIIKPGIDCYLVTNLSFFEKIQLIYYFFIEKSYFCVFMSKDNVGKYFTATIVNNNESNNCK